MRRINYILLLLTGIFGACSKEDITLDYQTGEPCEVFIAADADTKTAIDPDGFEVTWSNDDKISVWATTLSNESVFENTPFNLVSKFDEITYFSTTLKERMADGTYIYYATYPEPAKMEGTIASFNIPAIQNGKYTDAAVMLSEPTAGAALRADKYVSEGLPRLHMRQMTHLLKLYMPQGGNILGEPIRKIVVSFPRNLSVAGTMNVDITDPSIRPQIVSSACSNITIIPDDEIPESTSSERKYLFASICPLLEACTDEDKVVVKFIYDDKIAKTEPFSLRYRSFDGGHSTPIKMAPSIVTDFPKMKVTITGNNLGEDVYGFTIKAPEGCTFGAGGTDTFEFTSGEPLHVGDSFNIGFNDEDCMLDFCGKELTITYESESAFVTGKATVAAAADDHGVLEASAAVPYLLFEDFSQVPAVSSNDAYTGGFSTGSKEAVNLVNGWTGARVGAQAGNAIRIAARRETSADYDTRVDGPVMRLKKPVKLNVSFDYSSNRQEGGLGTKPQAGINVYIGHTEASDTNPNSGSTAGTYDRTNNKIYLKETTGSYTNINHHAEFVLNDVEGSRRLSIRGEVEHKAGTTNSTVWFYIDNVKVFIDNN